MNKNELEILAHAEAIAYYPAVTPSMERYAQEVKPGLSREQIKGFYKCPPLYGLERLINRKTLQSERLREPVRQAAAEIIEEIDTSLAGVHSRTFDSIGSGCSTRYTNDEYKLLLIERKSQINRWLEYAQAAERLIDKLNLSISKHC